MELNRQDTKMLQGISVLAMVWLHLFCIHDYADKFTPLVYFGGDAIILLCRTAQRFLRFRICFLQRLWAYGKLWKGWFL